MGVIMAAMDRTRGAWRWTALLLLALFGLSACYQSIDTPALGPGQCRVDLDCADRLTCARDDGPIGRCVCRATSPACFNGIDGTACSCDAEGCRCLPADSPGACDEPQPAAASAQCSGAQLCAPDGTCACFRDDQCAPGRRCQADDQGLGRCTCPYGEAEDGNCIEPDAPNACGGETALPFTAGEACGTGDWGRWTCTGCDAARCCAPWAPVPDCCAPDEGRWSCATEALGVPCCDPETELPDPCGRCVRVEQLGILASYGFEPGARADDPCLPEPDRPDVSGRWVCDARGQPRCLACTADDRNVCGGCGRLDVLGQERSEDISDLLDRLRGGEAPECDNARHGFSVSCPGTLHCEGGNTVRCRGEAPNACGECGPVTVCTEGEDCCQLQGDGSAPACTEQNAPYDLPGGLSALTVGAACGDESCGRLLCAPAAEGVGQVMRCGHPADVPNACGGCSPLQPQEGHCRDVPRCLKPGEECTTFDEQPGQWVCGADQGHVICVPSFRNECGGTQLLADRPGTGCAYDEPDGVSSCPSTIICTPGDDTLNSTTCEPVLRNLCGCCETECLPPFAAPVACPGYSFVVGPNLACLSDGTGQVCVTDLDVDGRCTCTDAQGEVGNCSFFTATVPPRLDDACVAHPGGGWDCSCVDANDFVADCGGRNELCCPSLVGGQPECPQDLECLPEPLGQPSLCRCGAPSQVCCAGELCDDAGFSCQGGRCAVCGAPGQVCCPGDACTLPGTSCQAGACQACGGPGQPCCDGATCADGALTCAGGQCQACGGPNQICCGGNTCGPGNLLCSGGQCLACGAANQPCCGNGLCDADRVCDARANRCLDCGSVGQTCCDNATCNAGGLCQNNQCSACGGQGQICCAGNVCNAGNNVCGAAGTCLSCGQTNQACCAGGVCAAGRVCEADSGQCATCGGIGQPCCANNVCNTGACDALSGVCQ